MSKYLINRGVKPSNAYFEIEADGYEQKGTFLSFFTSSGGKKTEVKAVNNQYVISLEKAED